MPDDTLTIGLRGDAYERVEIFTIERHEIPGMIRTWEKVIAETSKRGEGYECSPAGGAMHLLELFLGDTKEISPADEMAAVYFLNGTGDPIHLKGPTMITILEDQVQAVPMDLGEIMKEAGKAVH